jgi:hypothetical protein
VAEPCREIAANPADVYKYTAKGNLVAVVSNGTAVLGLGDIGAAAGKPVMEGKGVLFKRFADVDVFDIEVDTHDPDEIIKIVKALEPTFGGINLEDIKAPECFYIEETLKKQMKIPVFHDDQHGTAIISGAALLNALEVTGKKIGEIKVVFSGAGAAGIACAKFYLTLGVKRENLILVDTKGVVYKGRKEGMNPYKEFFAADTRARTLADAVVGADVEDADEAGVLDAGRAAGGIERGWGDGRPGGEAHEHDVALEGVVGGTPTLVVGALGGAQRDRVAPPQNRSGSDSLHVRHPPLVRWCVDAWLGPILGRLTRDPRGSHRRATRVPR